MLHDHHKIYAEILNGSIYGLRWSSEQWINFPILLLLAMQLSHPPPYLTIKVKHRKCRQSFYTFLLCYSNRKCSSKPTEHQYETERERERERNGKKLVHSLASYILIWFRCYGTRSHILWIRFVLAERGQLIVLCAPHSMVHEMEQWTLNKYQNIQHENCNAMILLK